jgi:hypothetical protein
MSTFDKFLESLNPIGSAEASPLVAGMKGYDFAKAQSAALAFGKGATDKEVWKKFGLYKNPMLNGSTALLGEIPDNNAKLNGATEISPNVINFLKQSVGLTDNYDTKNVELGRIGVKEHRKISDVLNHPELFSNSPDLVGVPLTTEKYTNKTLPAKRGQTDIDLKRQLESGPLSTLPSPMALYNTIKELNSPLIAYPSVSVNYANNDQLLSTLLHELTHATQYKYGLGQGANSSENDFETYYSAPGEQQSRMTQARALMSPQELADESPKTTMERLMRLHKNEK